VCVPQPDHACTPAIYIHEYLGVATGNPVDASPRMAAIPRHGRGSINQPHVGAFAFPGPANLHNVSAVGQRFTRAVLSSYSNSTTIDCEHRRVTADGEAER